MSKTSNVLLIATVVGEKPNHGSYSFSFEHDVQTVRKMDGTYVFFIQKDGKVVAENSTIMNDGDAVLVEYYESNQGVAVFDEMNESRSVSFFVNNRMYILDGKNYLVYDGKDIKDATVDAYVPTTYINITVGDNETAGVEYEQRNILSPKFKNTFIPDGLSAEFILSERDLDSEDVEVFVYGVKKEKGDFSVDAVRGIITFAEEKIPPISSRLAEKLSQGYEDGEAPNYNSGSDGHDVEEADKYPEYYAGVEVVASKKYKSLGGIEEDDISDVVKHCTIATVFDNRVFFSGNPKYPNHIFFCGFSNGYADPSYIGVLNYMQDGVGNYPITGMIPVSSVLMVLKADNDQDGTTFFHTPTDNDNGVLPKIYPSTQGLGGIGCLGACVNFLDDPVFVSRLGLEGVSQLSVRLERSIQHRSSLVDAYLTQEDLASASLCEWNGYLVLYVGGKIYLADSRQRFTHDIGVPQYEWYYIEGVGVYDGQKTEYRYGHPPIDGITVQHNRNEYPLIGGDGVDSDGDVNFFDRNGWIIPYVIQGDSAIYCTTRGNKTGGTFCPASVIKSIHGNIFFGTENGVVCSFNFDKRGEDGVIPTQYYSFDERVIMSGCAMLMDCCGIPHLVKKTEKKSMVIKTKAFLSSSAKIKVRTNRKPYTEVSRINSDIFSFESIDFSDFSFSLDEKTLFSINEKEKKWIEKQIFIYSDEFLKPFGLFNVSYRYQVTGRYKE